MMTTETRRAQTRQTPLTHPVPPLQLGATMKATQQSDTTPVRSARTPQITTAPQVKEHQTAQIPTAPQVEDSQTPHLVPGMSASQEVFTDKSVVWVLTYGLKRL